MAAAFLRDYSSSMEVVSAGRIPSQSIDSLLVEAMHECLVDLDGYEPRNLDAFDESAFDVVYECPDLPCPPTMDECRVLRDFIKNEAYLFFRGL